MQNQEVHQYVPYIREQVVAARCSSELNKGHYAIATEECASCGCSEMHLIHDWGDYTTAI